MLIADIGIVQNAMTVLNFEPDVVDNITELLLSNSEDLNGTVVTKVPAGWFGGSTNAHRIGTNTVMAHQAVEEELQKLADSLRQYSVALTQWANEVRDVDLASGAAMVQRAAAVEQVNTTIVEARDESASDNMGDGQYTEPPASDGSTS
jgi:hypothetical protein